jgi:heme/copper-type cytochrome/quinol oxidase subunit 2
MKKILWIVGTAIACVLWYVLVAFITFAGWTVTRITTHSEAQSINTDLLGLVTVLGCIALVILSMILWKRWNARCHVCKRWNALELTKTETLKQEDISVCVEVERRNSNREVVGTQDQYIPGKRKTYRDTYKCKYCGHLETYTYTKDKASI